MKWYKNFTVIVVLACGLGCLVIGIFWGKSICERKYKTHTPAPMSIEVNMPFLVQCRRLENVGIYSNSNCWYGFPDSLLLICDICWVCFRTQQDTTIDSLWGPDPIPPPAGLEMSVDRAIQEMKKPKTNK